MEYDLRLLRAFVKVARLGSFSRAAHALGLTQSSVSLQIKRLEDAFGFQLIRRSTRSVSLSAEGEALLESANVIIERLELMRIEIRRLRMAQERQLRVGTSFFSVDVADRNALLEKFAVAFPGFRMNVHDAPQQDIIAAVSRSRIELGIVIGNSHDGLQPDHACPPGHYPLALRGALIGTRPLSLLVPVESPLAHLETIEPHDLNDQTVLLLDPSQHAAMSQALGEWLSRGAARPTYHYEARHAVAVERYAAAHRLPCISMGWFGEYRGDGMARRALAGFDWKTDLVVLKADQLSAAGQAFLNLANDPTGSPRR